MPEPEMPEPKPKPKCPSRDTRAGNARAVLILGSTDPRTQHGSGISGSGISARASPARASRLWASRSRPQRSSNLARSLPSKFVMFRQGAVMPELAVLLAPDADAHRFLPEGPRRVRVNGVDCLAWVVIQTQPGTDATGLIRHTPWPVGSAPIRDVDIPGRIGFILPTDRPITWSSPASNSRPGTVGLEPRGKSSKRSARCRATEHVDRNRDERRGNHPRRRGRSSSAPRITQVKEADRLPVPVHRGRPRKLAYWPSIRPARTARSSAAPMAGSSSTTSTRPSGTSCATGSTLTCGRC